MNRWYERAGGYWVSIALHILFFSVMVSMTVVRAKLTEPPPVEVTIVAAAMESGDEAPADAAQPAPAFEASPVMETGNEDNVSTVPPDVKESEEETNEPPAPATEEAKKEPPKPEATKEPTPTPKPDPAQQAEMAERERQKRLDELVQRDWEAYQQAASAPANNDKLSASGAKLKEAIQGEEVKMKGKKLLDPTAGDEVGAIREFDLRGPQNVVQDILARYQMRTVTRYVSEAQVAVKYLNQAETNRGTYRSTDRPGLYEVFEIGPAGSAKMKQLEMDTLKIRGFNPRTDRLVKIVFGIVLTDKGYDLGVLDLQAEKMNP